MLAILCCDALVADEAAFPQHLPKKTPIGAKMRRDAVTSSTLTIVLAPAFRF
jgi:hypothetical protein